MNYKSRKFAYKHPTFGRSKVAKSREPFKNSVYYYWWEFLKRNDAYMKCCLNKGDGKLNSLYQDFGDVFNADFKTWWNGENRGVTLFAEELLPEFAFIQDSGQITSDKNIL